ncbi:MAG: glycoside hydrolase family 26 protein [Thermomicrobiales bacterium]
MMRRRTFMKISGAALGAALVPLADAQFVAAAARPRAVTPIALGAYIAGAPGDPTQIDQFTALVGAAPAVVMWYQDWAHSGVRDFNPTQMNAVTARNAMPMVTWEPWDSTAGVVQPAYSLHQIIAGAYDAYIHQWARAAAAWARPMYLRFAHEMNGNWYPWCSGVNGNTSAQYIAAWKHVHAIFQQERATNVRWVWSPNVSSATYGRQRGAVSTQLAALYPGDASVNWIALDGYNWGMSQSWSRWTDLATVFGASYTSLAKLTSKPMMLAETASTELGGNKAAWITQGFLTDIPARFPRVRAVIWFDENKETDWRVNSSPASLAAYRGVAQSAIYQGRLA